ncbi:uncharacterized protein IUM83_11835 [Phytophthora cinnamomi]|uniref:uncharacterized protein n=1 Tax=Phytophthora cinnamomi TaxID=4785 RepID=UPI003559B7B7|nr:hypothetical protein IUM83_11835 [Phytophthora cinnamomi]
MYRDVNQEETFQLQQSRRVRPLVSEVRACLRIVKRRRIVHRSVAGSECAQLPLDAALVEFKDGALPDH